MLEEEVYWHGHHSMIYKIKILAVATILSAFGIYFLLSNASEYFYLSIIALAIVAVIAASLFLHHIRYHYLVSNYRISVEEGILSKKTTEIPIEDVESLHVEQSKFERLFNVGSVRIASSALHMPNVSFTGISNPEKIKNLILKIQHLR